MQQQKVHAGVFLHPDLGELKKAFFKKFTLIQAGGGLVENSAGEWLMIHRRGFWDLPKGKLDKGETIEQCALREVMEETGLKSVSLEAPLIITWHTYHEGTKFILKESHWYKMKVTATDPLIPQAEEDITEAKWVLPAEIEAYIPTVYPSVSDVLLIAGSK